MATNKRTQKLKGLENTTHREWLEELGFTLEKRQRFDNRLHIQKGWL